MAITFNRTNSGIFIPSCAQRPPKRRDRHTAFDFFAGCGGFSLGVIMAGFEVVGANEWDAAAALTYMVNLGSYPMQIHYIDGEEDKARLNKVAERYVISGKSGLKHMRTSGSGYISHHPEQAPVRNFWFGDVRNLKGKDILDALDMKQGDLDLVIGGPPCQGFSVSGKQNIADPRNNLVYEYGRMIVELQPKTFLMEEVPALLNFFDPDGVPVLDKFCLILSEGGYGLWDHLKKSFLMQSGTVAIPKGMRGNASLNKINRSDEDEADEVVTTEEPPVQMALFGEG